MSWLRMLRIEGDLKRRRPDEQHSVTSQVSRVLTCSVACKVRMCVVDVVSKVWLDELIVVLWLVYFLFF